MPGASEPAEFDLVIVGSGSANSIPGPEFDDWSIALVERSVFGGTCLNVGCIPSKMFVYAADVADTIDTAATYGISASFDGADWPAIRDRVFGRIDPIAEGGKVFRCGTACPNIDVFLGEGRFVADRELAVELNDGGTARIRGDSRAGAGARPFIPAVPAWSARPITRPTPHATRRAAPRMICWAAATSLPTGLWVLGAGARGHQ